jgi:hypothetical protein
MKGSTQGLCSVSWNHLYALREDMKLLLKILRTACEISGYFCGEYEDNRQLCGVLLRVVSWNMRRYIPENSSL